MLLQVSDQILSFFDQLFVVTRFFMQSTAFHAFSADSIYGRVYVFQHFHQISAGHFVFDRRYRPFNFVYALQ